jgi:hypothetical protein
VRVFDVFQHGCTVQTRAANPTVGVAPPINLSNARLDCNTVFRCGARGNIQKDP